MADVWILTEGAYSDRGVVGVYTSERAAQDAAHAYVMTERRKEHEMFGPDYHFTRYTGIRWRRTEPDAYWPAGRLDTDGTDSEGGRDFGIVPYTLNAPALIHSAW